MTAYSECRECGHPTGHDIYNGQPVPGYGGKRMRREWGAWTKAGPLCCECGKASKRVVDPESSDVMRILRTQILLEKVAFNAAQRWAGPRRNARPACVGLIAVHKEPPPCTKT